MSPHQLPPHQQTVVKKTGSSTTSVLLVAVYLLLLTTAVRLPFFFRDVINWDESTYILMGQSLLDGHLPYTDFWELKPPLLFLFYALFISIFGKSIISIRIAGALCVALVSFLTYLVGKTLWNHQVGIVGATLFIVMSSLLPTGQATMTEHIALVPLVSAFTLLVMQKPTARILFFAGILMAIASMVRLNLAYVAVIVGFFAVLEKPLRPRYYILQRGLAYAAGSCLVIALTYLPYLVAGQPQIWWLSVILAPLSYANSQLSISEAFRQHTRYIGTSLANIWGSLFGISVLVWMGGLAGIPYLLAQWSNASQEQRRGVILLFLFFVGTALSILKGGAAFSHYLIQLVPFMALAAAVLLNALLVSRFRWLTTGFVVLLLAVSLKPIIVEYQSLTSRIVAQKTLTYGPTYEIAAYLSQENPSKEPIYMMTDHIVYWFLDAKPLSKFVHPSVIAKEYLLKILVGADTSTEKEMAKILAQKPKFIVKKKYIWYLRNKIATKLLLEENLRTQYNLVKEIEGRQIYRRINS
jgi:4-amino-4-deoxy-L-arabinose transferase-like glycosyltransferase